MFYQTLLETDRQYVLNVRASIVDIFLFKNKIEWVNQCGHYDDSFMKKNIHAHMYFKLKKPIIQLYSRANSSFHYWKNTSIMCFEKLLTHVPPSEKKIYCKPLVRNQNEALKPVVRRKNYACKAYEIFLVEAHFFLC